MDRQGEPALLTVLLDRRPPMGADLRGWLEKSIAGTGAQLLLEPEPALHLPDGARTPLRIGRDPFPLDGFDLGEIGGGAAAGAGFISFLPPSSRPSDPWGEAGLARAMSRVVENLFDRRARAVVFHRAAKLISPHRWIREAGDLRDAAHRPFGLWMNLLSGHGGLHSLGMTAFGLPDVSVAEAPGIAAGEARDRAREAVLWSCHRMVRTGQRLRPGDEIAVPLGISAGDGPVEVEEPEVSEAYAPRYRIAGDGGRIQLEPLSAAESLAASWARSAEPGAAPMPLPAYRAMVLAKLALLGWEKRAWFFCGEAPSVPVHQVLAFERPDGTWATMTCGIARAAQPGGPTERVELLLSLPGTDPRLPIQLSMLARALHRRGSGQRLEFSEPLPPLGIKCVAFGPAGHIELPPGPPISLLQPIPMTYGERRGVGDANLTAEDVSESWARVLRHAKR